MQEPAECEKQMSRTTQIGHTGLVTGALVFIHKFSQIFQLKKTLSVVVKVILPLAILLQTRV